MVRLKPGQRRLVVAHLPGLANVAAGSLLFGQFLSARLDFAAIALVGLVTWVVLSGVAFLFAAGDES